LKELEVANWAEDDAGNIDPDILYPIVGSVHNANKRTVDLTDKSSGLKLAVILGEDTNMEDANLKQEIADQLNNQEELKSQIEEINNQLPENEKKSAIIVINGEALNSNQAEVTQIAIRSNLPIEKRYLLENGTLRQMLKEEEPLLMPPLSAPDHRFIRTDTGEQVMLRGVNLQHLNWGQFSWNKPERALNVLKGIKEMGANYVVIMWNSGLIEDPVYIESLLNALEYAHNGLGLRVQLDLVSRGLSNPNDPYSDTETGIRILDEQVTKDWKKLLVDSEVALRIGRTVDIFNIISEPANPKISGKQSFFDPVLNDSCQVIRSSLNNPNAICGYSAGRWGWAGDADELIGHQRSELGDNITINLHHYRLEGISEDTRSDPRKYADKLQQNGFNISVGEFGWSDWVLNPDLPKDLIIYFEENKISYAVWGLVGGYFTDSGNPGDAGVLINDYGGVGLSPVGEYVKQFWSQYPDE